MEERASIVLTSMSHAAAAWPMAQCRIVSLPSIHFARGEGAYGDHSGVKYGGLPIAFLVAGANCVLASCWIVEHECRVVFWYKFYEALMKQGVDVAETMRNVQVWLRELTEVGEASLFLRCSTGMQSCSEILRGEPKFLWFTSGAMYGK